MRLIAADALKESFRDSFDACDRWEKDAIDNEIKIRADASRHTFLEAILRTNDMPTVEQPQIVRCKDCKYWQTNTQFCTRWSAPFATQHTSPNWYCADAERKDGDGE